MSIFKPGQEVVCVHKGPWNAINKPVLGSGPMFNELCTIIEEKRIGSFNGYLIAGYEINSFTGRMALYKSRWFRPVMTSNELNELLEEVEKSKTIELV